MIISHRYKYLFVELPRTGSTAVRRELRALYDGQPVLYKHATYDEFLKVATPAEKEYFVFSTIRNPLDQTVSRYFKVKTDHKRQFSDPQRAAEKRITNRIIDNRVFRFLQRSDADFPAYLRRYHQLPFDTWASLSHRQFDCVMRFERLTEDFDHVLRRLGIEPERPLPVTNPTAARERDFASYYPPETHALARRVFGPYMEKFGYAFPADWKVGRTTTFDRAGYLLVSGISQLYWRHLRPRLGQGD